MRQSWVEIEHYSVVYFDRITAFKALQHRTSVKGSYTLCRLIRYSCSLAVHMSPSLNGSFALQRFECGNMVQLCNGIMYDFYPGLPHIADKLCNGIMYDMICVGLPHIADMCHLVTLVKRHFQFLQINFKLVQKKF